jgi:hypothetical protein
MTGYDSLPWVMLRIARQAARQAKEPVGARFAGLSVLTKVEAGRKKVVLLRGSPQKISVYLSVQRCALFPEQLDLVDVFRIASSLGLLGSLR